MKVLFVTLLNKSQFYLMAPLAWSMRTAGHHVQVACQPDLAETVAGIGLTPIAVGRTMAGIGATLADAEPEPTSMSAPGDAATRPRARQVDYGWGDVAGEFVDMATDFFPLLTPDSFVEDLVAHALTWRPDLVVWNTLAFAGPVAARVSGAAHARMPWGVDALAQLRAGFVATRGGEGGDPLRSWLEPFLAAHGHHFDEEIVTGQWTVDPSPSWLFHPKCPGVDYVPVRAVPFNGPSTVPAWVHEPPQRRRVCLTLGFSHRESHGIEAPAGELLEAVGDLDAEVIATFDGKQLGAEHRLPGNVRVVDFVPLGALLPSCAAIVHHGGTGTFNTALEHGVPQLVVPGTYWHEKWWAPVAQGNALEDQGAGVYVGDSDQVTAELLHKELSRVLDDPSYVQNAERLRVSSAGVPTPNEVVPLIERLTREHRAVGR